MTAEQPAGRPGVVAGSLVRAIDVYRAVPRRRQGSCRYVPTCSSYAATAVAHHGALRGSWLALRRLLRCSPFGSFGYDPVPGVVADETRPPTDRPSVSDSSTPRAA